MKKKIQTGAETPAVECRSFVGTCLLDQEAGCDVSCCAAGPCFPVALLPTARKPKIPQQHVAVSVEKDVFRLDIPVHEAPVVSS